jgi:hypothetical protein
MNKCIKDGALPTAAFSDWCDFEITPSEPIPVTSIKRLTPEQIEQDKKGRAVNPPLGPCAFCPGD